jgi:predicted dienelactone hydrolase
MQKKTTARLFTTKYLTKYLTKSLISKLSIALSMIVSSNMAMPAQSAETITLEFSPFYIDIPISAIEEFAETGKLSPELTLYSELLEGKDLTSVRQMLTQTNPLITPQVINLLNKSPIGQSVIALLGNGVRTADNQNGAESLSLAMTEAVESPAGLSLLTMIRYFPGDIRLQLHNTVGLLQELAERTIYSHNVYQAIERQSLAQAETEVNINPATLADIAQPGPFTWEKQSFTFRNPDRDTDSPIDVYLPNVSNNTNQIPVVVISHGLGSDQSTFAYLAEHLASYGFAVIMPLHIGTDTNELARIMTGYGSPIPADNFLNRPLDITYALNTVEARYKNDPVWQGRLNLAKVGLFGQSFGGYTAVASAGADVSLDELRERCANKDSDFFLNMSLFLQCRAVELPEDNYALRDERVQAIIAVNPLTSGVFNQETMGKINIPTMIVSGTLDTTTPALPEQIIPYTWLTTPNKHLLLVRPGTHFTFIGGGEESGAVPVPPQLIGPPPPAGFPYMQTMATAFFQNYIVGDQKYQPYLTARYAKQMSQEPFQFSLVQEIDGQSIRQELENKTQRFQNIIERVKK